jgi:hypothetical protein
MLKLGASALQPPNPPPPPPLPPSPPTPPLPPSCAPRTSSTFYCDAQLGMCYSYAATAAFFSNAQTACQQQGGSLVKYDSAAKQLLVERFFKKFGTLTGNMYWHGLSRASKQELLLFSADGVESQPYASEEPYAHWCAAKAACRGGSGGRGIYLHSLRRLYVLGVPWLRGRHPAALSGPLQWLPARRTWQMGGQVNRDVNCAAAAAATMYDTYLGDDSATAQASQASYLTAATSAERKYGWELTECRTALPYICEVAPDRWVRRRRRRDLHAAALIAASDPACARTLVQLKAAQPVSSAAQHEHLTVVALCIAGTPASRRPIRPRCRPAPRLLHRPRLLRLVSAGASGMLPATRLVWTSLVWPLGSSLHVADCPSSTPPRLQVAPLATPPSSATLRPPTATASSPHRFPRRPPRRAAPQWAASWQPGTMGSGRWRQRGAAAAALLQLMPSPAPGKPDRASLNSWISQPTIRQCPPLPRYFASRKSLPRVYWTGMERNGSFSLYAYPDLSYLSQTASLDPYAHW